MRILVSLILLFGTMFGAACQANRVEASIPLEVTSSPIAEPLSTPLPVSPSPGDTQMTPSLPVHPDPGLQTLVDKAIADLARRLSIPVAQIKLMEAREVVWADASMGCPKPGMVYAQVQVDGLLIRLAVGKEMYLYHTDGTADPFLCENTSPVIINVTPKTDEFVPPPDSEID